jgi:hypothetical protein
VISRLHVALRDAPWLNLDRVQSYGRVLLVVCAGFFAISIDWKSTSLPIAHDFAAFWTAANLAVQGRALDAYGEPARRAMQALFGKGTYPPFFYSPIGLLIWLPFGLLPALAAAGVWVTGTAAAYAVALRALLRQPLAVVLLAYPAVVICALYGQNGVFSAALFGGVALTLDRSPIAAGLLIGLLAYKPQLGVAIPLALICARRFHAVAAAGGTVLALAAAAAAVFGRAIWTGFLASLPAAKAYNAAGVPGFDRFVSPYAAARLLGGTEFAGWVTQACFSFPACTALIWICLRRPGAGAETAALVMATALCVPFLGEYDLAILAVPGAWIAAEACRSGWLPYERVALALLYLSPAAIKIAAYHGVPLGPLAMAALAWLTFTRASLGGHQNHNLIASVSLACLMSNINCD